MYTCSYLGCSASTDGHYCSEHAAYCASCRQEYTAASLVGGQCADCRHAECEDELDAFVSARCVCGGHPGRAPAMAAR